MIMANNVIIQIVASQSDPEREAEFNRWYTEVHVPMLFGYEGVKQASRYKRIGEGENSTKYLAIYEFESKEAMEAFPASPEFAAAVEDFENKKKDIGFNAKWAASYELIKSWKR
jgi:uncharacterized protein (TIGR02118 family)